ncbi:aminotransferase class V-fold PLP-dependent enzyme [Streptomyces armeniacus]|uniref:Aminotransferase class V-fold PLP-dependent enzyme n=1 Tax=Streptomyces armeniacus TaxID=83291 RepID=A0A345XTS0_9ACTN|nr:aminotransferase class V-fold PLP-dependent enzyme [Streptomyces armeniacus]AXK35036.1 aminotransferase class V-fold PLP-dependent enzyme [Streptomyces armeniacus]
MDRRFFTTSAAGAAFAAAVWGQTPAAAHTATHTAGDTGADADMPTGIRDLPALWDVDRSVANLENAYWGVMPRSIEREYLEQTRFLNRRNVLFVRDGIPGNERTEAMDQVRAEVARLMAAPKEEFVLTRNGTEAMQNLIMQYGRLQPGDSVMYADLDYDEMQQAMESLRHHRGANVITFAIPEPATTANILAAYEEQLRKAPAGLKLLLVTHMSNRTGIVMPVREIVEMARARGVDTLVDATQTIGHIDFTLPDMNADFVGFSLHKWLCAPLGTGAIWIRGSRLRDIETCMGNTLVPADDTRSRASAGTVNFAAALTVPKAIAFHERIGGRAKQEHLQGLRNHWVERARDIKGLQILTPDDPERHGAVTSFRLPAMKDYAQAQRMAKILLEKHRVLTVARKGIARGSAVRVTPTLYNTRAELDRLVKALHKEAAAFR